MSEEKEPTIAELAGRLDDAVKLIEDSKLAERKLRNDIATLKRRVDVLAQYTNTGQALFERKRRYHAAPETVLL